jgi:hypothetical protein
VLGLPELQKPATLVGRGGAWFGHDELEIHLGVEKEFAPARKAHPAFLVDDLAAIKDRLRAAMMAIVGGMLASVLVLCRAELQAMQLALRSVEWAPPLQSAASLASEQ